MVSKSFIASTFLLCFTTLVDAHALINPALGVQGQGARNDVQNPSDTHPCGNVNIAQTFDNSQTASVNANGSISTTITDFNGGADGSRKIQTVEVDPSGTGNNFVPATMLVNGDPAPANAGTEPILIQLPSNVTCTGGTSKNKCLVSLKTTAGFGNCIVAQDSGDNTKGQQQDNATKNNVSADNASNTTTGNDNTSDDKTGNDNNKGNNTTTGDNSKDDDKKGDNKTGKNDDKGNNNKSDTTTADNTTAKNSTDTKTGDKKDCNSGKSKANRRSLDRIASFKRSWSSRDWVKAL